MTPYSADTPKPQDTACSSLRNVADLAALRTRLLEAGEPGLAEFLIAYDAYPPAKQIAWKQEKFSLTLAAILEIAFKELINNEIHRRECRANLTRVEATVTKITWRHDDGSIIIMKIDAGGFKGAKGEVSPDLNIEAGSRVAILGTPGEYRGEPQLCFESDDVELLPPVFHNAPALALRRENPAISVAHVEKLEARIGEHFITKIAADETLLNDLAFSRWNPETKAGIRTACVKIRKLDDLSIALHQIGATVKTIARVRNKIETHPDWMREPFLLVFDGLLSLKQADDLRATPFFAKLLCNANDNTTLRIAAIIAQVMNVRRRDGHCGAHVKTLASYLEKQHGVSVENIASALNKCLVFYERHADCLFHKDLWDRESHVARMVKARRDNTLSKSFRAAAIKQTTLNLNPQQRIACRAALSRSLSIVTGGPGTGKTTMLGALRELMESRS
jgi:hypothetical protein